MNEQQFLWCSGTWASTVALYSHYSCHVDHLFSDIVNSSFPCDTWRTQLLIPLLTSANWHQTQCSEWHWQLSIPASPLNQENISTGFTLNSTHNPNLFLSKIFSPNLPMELSEPTQTMGPNVEAMTITMHPTSQKPNSRLSSNNTSPKLLMEIQELVGTENPNSEETTRNQPLRKDK